MTTFTRLSHRVRQMEVTRETLVDLPIGSFQSGGMDIGVQLEMAERQLRRDEFHGDWNYSLLPSS